MSHDLGGKQGCSIGWIVIMVVVTAGGPDMGPRQVPVLKEEPGGGYGSLEEEVEVEEEEVKMTSDPLDRGAVPTTPTPDHDARGPQKPALERYRELVLKYPQVASTVESAARTTSYFLPGERHTRHSLTT